MQFREDMKNRKLANYDLLILEFIGQMFKVAAGQITYNFPKKDRLGDTKEECLKFIRSPIFAELCDSVNLNQDYLLRNFHKMKKGRGVVIKTEL